MAEPITFETMTYRVADSGVAFVAMNVKDRPVNVLTPEMHQDFGRVAEQLAGDDSAIGAVIHSAKSSFMAGGDLKRIVRYYDQQRTPEEAYAQSRSYTESLRKLETCGKPVAVAMNGTALGGGLELALACHYRVVIDNPKVLLGLPEVTLGLLPAGGGTQRLPRLIGLKQAASLILSGRHISPAEALELGVVHKLASAGDLLAEAEQWVLNGGSPQQPWDQKGFEIPGGARLNDMNVGRLFQQLTAKVSLDFRRNYPAPVAILRCLFNGTTVSSMDAALKIETREFSALTRDPVARNIIRTMFINKKKASRSDKKDDESNKRFSQKCKEAYIREGLCMVGQGITTALIKNAAFAVGMASGPLAPADEMPPPAVHTKDAQQLDVDDVKLRLMCAQALVAAECWEDGTIEPVDADLVSIMDCGFPSYTGGVMSYIDTMGLGAFIALCDRLTGQDSTLAEPSAWLRARAKENERVYPSIQDE